MDILSAAHPFLVRDCGFNVMEIINIDPVIDGSHKAIGALNLFSRKFKDIVFTLPPQCVLTPDVGPQLQQIAARSNLKLVYLTEDQIPFKHDYLECFMSSDDAVLRLKGAIVIAKVVKDFADVTPFRTSALNILDLLKQPDVTFDRIEKGIIDEPLLVARILQVANSAFYMRRNPVDDIGNALAYLGLDGIRQVLVQLIFHNLATKYFVQQKHTLIHSECCAHLAVKLAERKFKDLITLGKVRVAGLLHDLGSLALQFSFPDEYAKVSALMNSSKCTTNQAERSIFGVDHCEVGARLCVEWKLPDYVRACAAEHHSIISGPLEKILNPVVCANAFLDIEIDQMPGMDYAPLLKNYSLVPNVSDNEAKMEVLAFLYETWKTFKSEHFGNT